MMRRLTAAMGVSLSVMLLAACGQQQSHRDLQKYIEDTKARPAGQIEPLPAFRPYRPYSYSVMTERSPFEPPAKEAEETAMLSGDQVEPDFNREKEYLEGFNVAVLSMVGTITKEGQLWALIDDGSGGVHAVTVGNYLGKNHGRIVAIEKGELQLMEIVSNGAGGWVERPRIIEIQEKE